jgi:hypothetical protein
MRLLSAFVLHYIIHQVDARQKHPAAAVAFDSQLIERAIRALAFYDAALEFFVLVAEQLTTRKASYGFHHFHHL